MGEAGGAQKELLRMAGDVHYIPSYNRKWDTEDIIGTSSSKNIPMLQVAADAVIALRKNDRAMLYVIANAIYGYLDRCEREGHFAGEAYSCIYWRWIVVPFQILRAVMLEAGLLPFANDMGQWLRDFILFNVLAAVDVRKFKQSVKGKKAGQYTPGIPTASIAFARSWVLNKGDDGKRRIADDSLSWIDATSHAPWLMFVLGYIPASQLSGGDGFVKDAVGGFTKQWGISMAPPLESWHLVELRDALHGDAFPWGMWDQVVYGPHEPVVLGRTLDSSYGIGLDSFSEGSTSFLHVKLYEPLLEGYEVYSIANPQKRSNSDPGIATLDLENYVVTLEARDGTVFDWDKAKDVEGTITVPLPVNPLWVVRVHRHGKSIVYLDPKFRKSEQEESEPWWKSLWRKIRELF
jgi:hypothetical protein